MLLLLKMVFLCGNTGKEGEAVGGDSIFDWSDVVI